MLGTILLILLSLTILIIISIGPYTGRMQAVTLWVGKKIAPEGMDREAPTGFQDAITPKIQDQFNTVLPIAYIITLISGSIIKWYLGVLVLIAVLMLVTIIQRILSNKICKYLKVIIYYMNNRVADYAKHNDHIRSEAAKDMASKLHDLYMRIREQDPEIPKWVDINNMPLG